MLKSNSSSINGNILGSAPAFAVDGAKLLAQIDKI